MERLTQDALDGFQEAFAALNGDGAPLGFAEWYETWLRESEQKWLQESPRK